MPASYLPYKPEQQRLLPDALQDWLPEGYLAYFISDSVDSLDLNAFHARYAKGGPRNQPCHPAMMVKVLIYGYATGTFSSRKLAAKLHEDVALRVLAAENYPAHRTLSYFCALHLQELADLFVQVVRLARECGLVKLGTVAVDGIKLKANASRHKAMSYERMDVARGRSQDDERKPRDKDGRPKGGRYKRDFGVPKDSSQESFTDTDSRIMKRAGGGFDYGYGYNAHTAVDEHAQIVVAAELSNNAADSDRLPVLLTAVKANVGEDAQQVLADAGFRSEAVFAQLKDSPSELIVALGREGKQELQIDAEKYPHTAAMDARLKTPQVQAAYRKRKWIVEAPNGWIKNVLGFRQFSLRGPQKVRAEFQLVCLALNLRRMSALKAG